MRNLNPEGLGDFLDQAKCAILATHFRDGRVLLSPVWHEWRDGGFTVVLTAAGAPARHITREPRMSIIVAEDVPPYRGIEVRGKAKRVPGDVHQIVHRMALRYLGAEHGPAFAATASQIESVVLRIEPGELRVWDLADEPDLIA